MSKLFELTDLLLWYGASNLVLAIPIAMLAWWIQSTGKSSFLAHLLWLLVLLKLVTPPLASIPVLSVEPVDMAFSANFSDTGSIAAASFDWKAAAVAVWLSGTLLILGWSSYCICRFNRLLNATSLAAEPELRRSAGESARQLGLKKMPAILTTSANVPPMVWWIGGRARIYIPHALAPNLDADSLRLIVAHELGHVRRGDHFIRWFEWLVTVGFWWNPLAWLARRNLRNNEELCCDALVISKLNPGNRAYGKSLISALEVMASPAIRPPAMATGINGGFMERRIKMVISKRSHAPMPRWLRNTALLGAAGLLPLGLGLAQETDNLDRVESWLESGVNSAFVTQEQADIMLEALKRSDLDSELNARMRAAAEAEYAYNLTVKQIQKQFESGQLTAQEARTQAELAKEDIRQVLDGSKSAK